MELNLFESIAPLKCSPKIEAVHFTASPPKSPPKILASPLEILESLIIRKKSGLNVSDRIVNEYLKLYVFLRYFEEMIEHHRTDISADSGSFSVLSDPMVFLHVVSSGSSSHFYQLL